MNFFKLSCCISMSADVAGVELKRGDIADRKLKGL